MSMNVDDSRITAYALGELEDFSEEERAAIEDAIERSPELQREIREIRATRAEVEETLAAEPLLHFRPEQRDGLERAIAGPSSGFRPSARLWVGLAASLVAVFLGFYLSKRTGDDPALPVPVASVQAPQTPLPPAADTEGPKPPRVRRDDVTRLEPPRVREDDVTRLEPPQVGEDNVPRPEPPPVPHAPEVVAEIRGQVTDDQGAALPGATVRLLDPATPAKEVAATYSGADGKYVFHGLKSGTYDFRVDFAGFESVERRVAARSGEATLADASLSLSSISETVTVTGAAPAMTVAGQDRGVPGGVVGGVPGGMVGGIVGTGQGIAAGGGSGTGPRESGSYLRSYARISRGDDTDVPSTGTPRAPFNTEAYDRVVDNPFLRVEENPLSTFSIDVDTASYANVRRFLRRHDRPPKDAVRIEELVNYFPYDYAPPEGDGPFAVHVETANAPWSPGHRLVRIGLKGRTFPANERPACNLVFLVDVSGSMRDPNKLPLVKSALKLLVGELRPSDRVAIVVYAGRSGLALSSTRGDNKEAILSAIDDLDAGGSTNGAAGIELAYVLAKEHFIDGGANRVILATDGDWNVGVTNRGDLTRLIEEKAKGGVFLTVLGFGMGNYKDATLEALADKGNGNYAYVDTLQEARKVLVEELGQNLVTIAKDVKIQVEFNPAEIATFRLIGYENRILRHEDFNDDKKDAGEIGAGHSVTALYELVPKGQNVDVPRVDPLKYQKPGQKTRDAERGETLTLKLRYKQPDGDTSHLLTFPVKDKGGRFADASPDFRFAAGVAAFGMVLRESEHKGDADFDLVLKLAEEGKGRDAFGYRGEFIGLVRSAKALF